MRCISSTARHTAEMAKPMSSVFLSIREGNWLMLVWISRSMYMILRRRPQPMMTKKIKTMSKIIKERGVDDTSGKELNELR